MLSLVDPNKWRPLIMSFQQFYGLGEQVYTSPLSSTAEELYLSPDVERAKSFTKAGTTNEPNKYWHPN